MKIYGIVRKIVEAGTGVMTYLRRGDKRIERQPRPVLFSDSLDPKVKDVLPQRGVEAFCRYYNREYRKYNSVKNMKKSIKLMSQEEFAYRRALMLTLRSVLILDNKEEDGDSVVELMKHKNVEEIETKLRQLK